ncbi:MAG TPA: substrate-binding domain-containing protein, partial [Promineifilum sp.]|nr:substrate-binding domain-containing protein [Promineifilum sp.]
MKKLVKLMLAVLIIVATLAAYIQKYENEGGDATVSPDGRQNALGEITVVSREGGSGTRGAFIELFSIEVKGEDGSKKDMTTKEAIIVNKTDVMLTNIANDPNAIGYVSLGSLNDTVKALSIDGVAASAENVKNGSYPIVRPFIIATRGEAVGLTADFVGFILSKEGQQVVSSSYIAVDETGPAYA